ncbi:hypothetical protein D187_008125 [Cystobacter fuscus DSM 2262]|uniref:Uncharacterized protein n=1 Tax=Cystobacter fuscus (strain ATCC 25194 / DSM 2262 / NBRC 100088 / M29) TaxID=1242864 RepID=S9NUJ3_CYSF2|nr:hypothetical protein D187_008125 [Cystobacter fuscus DSM 2262]
MRGALPRGRIPGRRRATTGLVTSNRWLTRAYRSAARRIGRMGPLERVGCA